MIVLGLTGSIGMGKSTTAKMFAGRGVPVHDSDEAVHRLYRTTAAAIVEAAFPGTVVAGVVDRRRLGEIVLGDRQAMKRLEAIVLPLVRADADQFLRQNRDENTSIVVLDVPLLFESGGRSRVDKVVVVSADPEIQRARVLARPGMTAQRLSAILQAQIPDSDKRRQADYVIDTSHGLDKAQAAVDAILADLLA